MNAALAALLGGAAGAALKYFFDQRASRRNKLLDEKLKYAVAFLSAADWTGRAYESYMTAYFAAERARTKGSAGHVATAEAQQRKQLEEAMSALKDAHAAACALRLLMPDLSDLASKYIELSIDADLEEQGVSAAREAARAALEAALIKDFKTLRRWRR
ncbi:hypothetical protein DMB66_18440 [Actinoplanes sp. ATCC 53533]|uniref:hypothetical protein n=1 Tax=Actinoplanes sp. ATCC 53533 TaxID=1288362 RepID=UPI000F7B21CC|nr:hypothetical protein [Actinoplanes sp. ATCC 53533]RSM64893.1 hypothetical protein DMB66_18440 [Actinoplanes sp. ATCC 53533]